VEGEVIEKQCSSVQYLQIFARYCSFRISTTAGLALIYGIVEWWKLGIMGINSDQAI
jgi:hypothetical protein